MSFTIPLHVAAEAGGANTYHVTTIEGVTLVFGNVPLSEATRLMQNRPETHVNDMRLANYAGATFAMGDREDCRRVQRERLVPACDALRRQHKAATARGLPASACEWLIDGERGISSDTMFSRFAGFSVMKPDFDEDTPQDPDDFNRCRLLLEAVPEFAARIDELRTISPVWDRLVSAWETLCATMDEEAPRWREGEGEAPKTYDLLREINAAEVNP